MSRRKLEALKYPCPFDPNDEGMFRNLVVWLEDQKIRHYDIKERGPLRDVGSPDWGNALNKYLQDMEIRIEGKGLLGRMVEVADILLSLAVTLEYGENPEGFNDQGEEGDKKKGKGPTIVAANPLDNLDFNSPDFIKGVNDLADLLKVTKHPNHLLTLEACGRLFKSRYSKEAVKNGDNIARKGDPFPFQDVDKSVKGGDPVFNQAAKILRLLFIMDLRDLQTKINECIVAVQSVTANPKTDTKLGKVGY